MNQVKVLQISTADLEGGAGRAAYRLNQGLNQAGANSQMLVRAKTTGSDSVISDSAWQTKLGPSADRLYLKQFCPQTKAKFSPQWFPDSIVSRINQLNPDLVHLHWICNGFMRIESLSKIQQPIVWTFHDMWPFTGGCHYTEGCNRYKDSCGQCPQLSSTSQRDLSAKVLSRKQKAWDNLSLTLVTPSLWLSKCVRESSLFKDKNVQIVAGGIDTQLFHPIDKSWARRLLNLPLDVKIILFGAGNPTKDDRKGFALLLDALNHLKSQDHRYYELAILGSDPPSKLPDLKFKTHYLGKFFDEISLALAYAAADVFVAPSRQDNLPNTILESLACGIPCVAFNIGGMPDMIEHQKNGFLAKPFRTSELADGIQWVLQNEHRYTELCHQARQTVEDRFTILSHVEHYLALYSTILAP